MMVDEEFTETSIDEFRLILERLPSLHKGAGQSEQLYELLTLYDFLQAKMEIISLEALIGDYALAKDLGGDAENLTFQHIAAALRVGTMLLRQAPEELWN